MEEIHSRLAHQYSVKFSEEIEKICRKYQNIPLNTSVVSVERGDVSKVKDDEVVKEIYYSHGNSSTLSSDDKKSNSKTDCNSSKTAPATFKCSKTTNNSQKYEGLFKAGTKTPSLNANKFSVKASLEQSDLPIRDNVSMLSVSHMQAISNVYKAAKLNPDILGFENVSSEEDFSDHKVAGNHGQEDLFRNTSGFIEDFPDCYVKENSSKTSCLPDESERFWNIPLNIDTHAPVYQKQIPANALYSYEDRSNDLLPNNSSPSKGITYKCISSKQNRQLGLPINARVSSSNEACHSSDHLQSEQSPLSVCREQNHGFDSGLSGSLLQDSKLSDCIFSDKASLFSRCSKDEKQAIPNTKCTVDPLCSDESSSNDESTYNVGRYPSSVKSSKQKLFLQSPSIALSSPLRKMKLCSKTTSCKGENHHAYQYKKIVDNRSTLRNSKALHHNRLISIQLTSPRHVPESASSPVITVSSTSAFSPCPNVKKAHKPNISKFQSVRRPILIDDSSDSSSDVYMTPNQCYQLPSRKERSCKNHVTEKSPINGNHSQKIEPFTMKRIVSSSEDEVYFVPNSKPTFKRGQSKHSRRNRHTKPLKLNFGSSSISSDILGSDEKLNFDYTNTFYGTNDCYQLRRKNSEDKSNLKSSSSEESNDFSVKNSPKFSLSSENLQKANGISSIYCHAEIENVFAMEKQNLLCLSNKPHVVAKGRKVHSRRIAINKDRSFASSDDGITISRSHKVLECKENTPLHSENAFSTRKSSNKSFVRKKKENISITPVKKVDSNQNGMKLRSGKKTLYLN